METLEDFRITDGITRAEMAKMISVYAEKFTDKTPDLSNYACMKFSDLEGINGELRVFIMKACQLGLMGYQADGTIVNSTFNPHATITRAEV